MIGFWLGFILFGIAVIAYKLNKRLYSLLLIYNVFWGILFILSNVSLFGMKKINVNTYVILFSGAFFWGLGWLIGIIKPVISFKTKKILISRNFAEIRNYLACILLIILGSFYLLNSVRTFTLLMKGYSYVYIRNIHQGYVGDAMFENNLEFLFHSLIGTPVLKAMMVINISYFFYKGEIPPKICFLTIIDIILYCFSTAGRFMIFYAVLLIGLNLIRYKNYLSIKNIRKIMMFTIMGVIALLVVTQIRGMGEKQIGNKIFKTVYIYFASPIGLFDYWLSYLDEIPIKFHGKMFFYGILDLLDSIIKYIFNIDWNVLKDASVVLNNSERFVKLYNNYSINAFVTSAYYYYADFGVIGVLVGNCIHGLISGIAEKESLIRSDLRDICVFNFITLTVIETFIRWSFVSLTNVLTIVYIIGFVRCNKKVGVEL